ncbi:DNA polymerase III subunit beta [Patescibacteria group bacterium]
MKFSCTQENLRQGLSIVSHIANKSVNLPILENVLIRTEDSGLKMMTTNLEMAVSCSVRGKVEGKGEFTVPSKLFADYVGLLPKERVDVEQQEGALAVKCASFETRLNGINASEFPLIPSVERKRKFTVKVNELRSAVGQVLFAVASNESRPEISGVLFKFVPQSGGLKLVLAATDSYRLAERSVSVKGDTPSTGSGQAGGEEQVSVIVPARAVSELVRILGVFKDTVDNPEDIEVVLSENQVLFSYNQVELISRTIDGKYPDYRQLVPGSFETEVKVQRDELVRAVKATALFSRTGLNDITLKFAAGQPVKISAKNPQTGEHASEVPGEVTGKENGITVNYRYFVDGVNNIETDQVSLQLIDGVSPCLLRPDKDDANYLYIVMPIRQ